MSFEKDNPAAQFMVQITASTGAGRLFANYFECGEIKSLCKGIQ